MKNMVSVAATTTKSVLVKPGVAYSTAEAKGFLGLGAGSSLVPSKYGMSVRKGKVAGADIIAYLESGSCRKSKIGRRYASGTVTVVNR